MAAPQFPDEMNPTDATLWEIKRDPLLRTTIVALALLDRAPDWATLAAKVEHAIDHLPRLRQRVAEGPLGFGRPHWVECRPDLDFHLRRVRAPGRGGLDAVLELCGHLAGEEFDDARPLWEIQLVEGLPDGAAALILKVSHSLTDGVGGAALLRAFDDESGDAVLRAMTPKEDTPTTQPRERISRLVSAPVGLVGDALETGLHPIRTVSGAGAIVGSAARLLSPAGPPLSPLMTDRGLSRRAGVTQIDLERFRRAAHRAGGTINDGFITVAVGALADYHRALGSQADRLRVTMPVSFRSDTDAQAGNQWTPARFVLDLDADAHPYDELQRHRGVLRAAAHEPAIAISQTLAAMLQELPAALTTGIVAGMVKGCDAALTDVPGLREPLTIAGASVTALHPFAPTGGAAVNIGLFSYLDRACIGFNMDSAAVVEPDRLVACFEDRADDFLRRRRRPNPIDSAAARDEQTVAQPAVHQRLSALDTSFLRMETPTTPMHMGGLFLVDGSALFDKGGRFDIEGVRAHIRRRLERFPRLTTRVEEVPFEIGRPVWVDAPDLDITHHIQVHTVPGSGSRADLLACCEALQMDLLDRSRPLFEFHFLVGLDPEEFGPHSIAIVEKVHHALLDGMSGVELLAALFDIAVDTSDDGHAEPAPDIAWDRRTDRPSGARLTLEAVIDLAREPAALARVAADALRSPGSTAAKLGNLAGAIGDLLRPASVGTLSLNRPVGSHRVLHPITVRLDPVHDAAAAMGGTVNDMVLTAISAGLRALLAARGETTDGPLTVLVPVSTRQLGHDGEPGNHVSGFVVELPVDEPDPKTAFATIAARVDELKQLHHADGTEILLEAADHLPPVAVDLISSLVGRQSLVNLVVTNLPGPPVPLYFGPDHGFDSGLVREMIPIVPLGGNLTVGVAVLSYAGSLVLSFNADGDACPDIDIMIDAVRTTLNQLVEPAGSDGAEPHDRLGRTEPVS